jgi:hypothetical protein
VLRHCREHGVPYTENSLAGALAIVRRHIDDVGLAASRTFHCPTGAQLGRR